MFNKYPKRTGIYHIKDNIEELQLEIHFRHVNTLLKLPKFEMPNVEDVEGSSLYQHHRLGRRSNCNGDDDNFTTIRLKWQQKIMSATEKELYSDERNCTTEIQKKYNQLLKEAHLTRRGTNNDYDNDDDDDDDDCCNDINKEREYDNKPVDRRRRRRKKKKRSKKRQTSDVERERRNVENETHVFTYVQEDNYTPPEDCHRKLQSRPKDSSSTTTSLKDNNVVMYVYAALTPDTQLMALRWDPSERVLCVYPDFNNPYDNPYFIEIDTDYRHLYAYACVNISKWRLDAVQYGIDATITYLALADVVTSMSTHWKMERDLNTQFEMPPKRNKRFMLLFEIRDGSNFEHEKLHIRYHIVLPSNTILEEGILTASTHTSRASTYRGVCHFGYSQQLTFLCEDDYNTDNVGFVHIYFELISIDTWEREHINGYAHCTLNLDALGQDSLELQCIRPVDSWLDVLKCYFIGGRRQFNFKRFFTPTIATTTTTTSGTTTTTEVDETFHNRYRCHMQKTGCLRFTYQFLVQRNCELLQPCKSTTSGMTLDDIMLAYREARRRLEAIVLK